MRLPVLHLVDGKPHFDQPRQTRVLEELVCDLLAPVSQARQPDASRSQPLQRRFHVGIGRQRGESVEDLIDLLSLRRAALFHHQHFQRAAGHLAEGPVLPGHLQRPGVAQDSSEPQLQRGGRNAGGFQMFAEWLQRKQCAKQIEYDRLHVSLLINVRMPKAANAKVPMAVTSAATPRPKGGSGAKTRASRASANIGGTSRAKSVRA